MERSLRVLRELRRQGRAAFVSDEAVQDRADRNAQLLAQACADIALHIIAASGASAPETYAEALSALGATGVIPAALAARLAGAVRLRNILVHGYLDIDHGRLFDELEWIESVPDSLKGKVSLIVKTRAELEGGPSHHLDPGLDGIVLYDRGRSMPVHEGAARDHLADGFLEEAEADLGLRRWRSCVGNAQLPVENSVKAVITRYAPVPRSHDLVGPLDELLAARRLSAAQVALGAAPKHCAADLGYEEHVRSGYGEEASFTTPWELFDQGDAEGAVEIATRARSLARRVLEAPDAACVERRPRGTKASFQALQG